MLHPAALHQLWIAHADRLLLIARSIDAEGAPDAVQDAFVALAKQPTVPNAPLAWLVKVTRNQLLQSHRGSRRRTEREQYSVVANWFESSVSMIDDRLDGQAVTSALQGMTSPTREIIVMHLWGDMTFESIADVVGISRASTHRRYKNGIEQLRSRFDDPHGPPTFATSETTEQ